MADVDVMKQLRLAIGKIEETYEAKVPRHLEGALYALFMEVVDDTRRAIHEDDTNPSMKRSR